jgi:spore germination cell wall hydrolase CwlJ-like protein
VKKILIDFSSSFLTLFVVFGLVFVGSAASSQEVIVNDNDVDYITEIRSIDEDTFPEVYCMALNVYYEARGSNLADQYAVADVVLNRADDVRYPNTICEVVKDGYVKGKRNCQFSWYCDGKPDNPKDEEAWSRAQSVAWGIVMLDKYRGISEGSTHYHAHYVNPHWNRSTKHFKITRMGRIGDHIFYRWN